jgi:hypothetical protein
MQTITKFFIIQLVVMFFSVNAMIPAARAAVINTETILSEQVNVTQNDLQDILSREDVREQLLTFGVDPVDADLRIAALTDAEINQLQQHINNLPAGSSALAVLGAVFLVLLVLELVGITNVFSKL